ncbi:MAG: alcohol dehydrogenase catalytic domain-containing protein [Planctomycetota bacterium]
MKSVCFVEVNQVAMLDLPDPEIEQPTDVLIRATLSGLCGSDLHPFWGREAGLEKNTVMGHEVVGEVVAIGNDVRNFSVGDMVFTPFSTSCGKCYFCKNGLPSRCHFGQLFGWRQNGAGLQGCQSEFVRIPLADGTLLKKPSGLSDVSALLLGDNFSTGYYCAEMANIQPGGCYAVIGCGTVGLLCIIAAKKMGAETIFAFDPVHERRKSAESLGAMGFAPNQDAVQAIMEQTDGRGVDSVMELVGIPDAQKLAYQLIRPGGTMSVIGCHCTPNFAFSPVDAYDKNLTYRTGRCPARHYMEKLTPQVADGEFELDDFVTHFFYADQCIEAYDVFSKRQDGCLKAAFRF